LNAYDTFIDRFDTPEAATRKIGSGDAIFNGYFNGLGVDDSLLFRIFYWALATA
jgi:hypothetical protein